MKLLLLALLMILPQALCAGAAFDLLDLRRWSGITTDNEISYHGRPAARWEHGRSPDVLVPAPADWSGFNCLEFTLHSNRATGGAFMLIVSSENPQTEGIDYYSFAVKLNWRGWKTFVVPFAEMPANRSPRGWNDIDSLQLTADGWGNEPDPNVVVHIAKMNLTRVEGPALSDEDFFGILDLGYPGLEGVRAAVEQRDWPAARSEFARHLRTREKPLWKWDWRERPLHESRPQEADTSAADRIMRRELPSVGVYHSFAGQIDWTLNPINYREWPWQLNRHPFWVALGRAYWATGDEKYAREFVYQMTDWVRRCPVPRNVSGNSSETWRTIEAGIRVSSNWPESYHLFLTSPTLDDDALITMVKSFVDHARHLLRWPTGGNWLCMEANGLMHVGVLFPEFREAAQWRKAATERLYLELDRQIYPDGAQIELTSGYHQVSLMNFVRAWEFAHLNSVPMPPDYVSKMERMYDYNLKAAMPNGYLPGLNDGDLTNIRNSLRQASEFFPARTDFRWVGTSGDEGQTPAIGSVALPFAGQLVMRTGWERDDLYALMDAGPFGYGHQHEDCLSLVVYAYGKYMLVDAGNYPYDSSEWRKYVLSTRSHNTVRIDGLDQGRRGKPRDRYVVSRPLSNRWSVGEKFDYAAGSYDDGYGSGGSLEVNHSRRVFFVKPEYWIVTDFLTPRDADSHRCESLFHLDASGATAAGTGFVSTTDKDSPNLHVLPLMGEGMTVRVVSGQETPEVQGWMPAKGYDVRPIPTVIVEKSFTGPDSLAYVLYPTPAGETCPVTAVEALEVESAGPAAAFAIRFADGRVDYFMQRGGSGPRIGFGGFETDAEAAWVSVRDGEVTAACAVGGTLTRAGEPVKFDRCDPIDLSRTDAVHRF